MKLVLRSYEEIMNESSLTDNVLLYISREFEL